MLARMSGLAIVIFWIVAMSWLVWHDIAPAWIAQDPPKSVAADWVSRYGQQAQFGIFDPLDRRIGGVWTRYTSGTSTERDDDVYLTGFTLLGPTHLHVKSVFDVQGKLDEIDITVQGSWPQVRIHGERFPAQFAFQLDVGPLRQAFKIDLDHAGTFSDAFRPFDALPNLVVGQSWRMQVFNPVAAVTGIGETFIPMIVRVVDRELIRINGELVDCHVVQTTNVKAWVDRRSGLVLVQEVTLPIGTYTVRYEPYDEAARNQARRDLPFRVD